MADSGLSVLDQPEPMAGVPVGASPSAALDALKAATARLNQNQGLNSAEAWLAMSAGFGAPTKTGSFFENLGGASQGLMGALQKRREMDMENARLQASMIGMQADLPLKAMQEKMLQRQMTGMDMLAGGPSGTAVPLLKGNKGPAGVLSQSGSSSVGAPAGTAGGSGLPEGMPAPAEVYATAKAPDPIAQATAKFSKATGTTPLYDVGKLLETGLYYQTLGAKYNLPQASEIGKTLTSQATEFIKQGAMPARMADGSTGIVPIPGYLNKMYSEHLVQNQAKWSGYGAAEKAAERANTRDRLTFEAQLDPKTTYDAYGNPQAPVSRFDLATGRGQAAAPVQTGVSGGVSGPSGTPTEAPVTRQPGPGGAGRTLEMPPQVKPVVEAEGKYLGDLPTHISMKQQELSSIEKMADAYKLVQSGKFAQHKAEISGLLKSVGLEPSNYNLTDRAQVQIALKEAMKNTLTSFKDIPAGSRFTQAEFMAMKNEGMANPDMEPEANLSILSSMHGVARNDLDFMSHLIKKVDSGQGRVNIGREMDNWYREKPLKSYVEESQKKLGPFKGMSSAVDPITAEIQRRAAARQGAGQSGE